MLGVKGIEDHGAQFVIQGRNCSCDILNKPLATNGMSAHSTVQYSMLKIPSTFGPYFVNWIIVNVATYKLYRVPILIKVFLLLCFNYFLDYLLDCDI